MIDYEQMVFEELRQAEIYADKRVEESRLTGEPVCISEVYLDGRKSMRADRDKWRDEYFNCAKFASQYEKELEDLRAKWTSDLEESYDSGLLQGSEVGDETAQRFKQERDDDMRRLQLERMEWLKQMEQARANNAQLLLALSEAIGYLQKSTPWGAEKGENLRAKYAELLKETK